MYMYAHIYLGCIIYKKVLYMYMYVVVHVHVRSIGGDFGKFFRFDKFGKDLQIRNSPI